MILYSAFLAPPRLLFSYSNLIRRINIDGENLMTMYTIYYPRALDYDFRLDSDPVCLHAITLHGCCIILGKVMCFG